MTSVGMHEAKTTLSRLVRRVQAGEEIEITKDGVPVARLVAPSPRQAPRVFGSDRGRLTVPDDFDAPLPPDVLELFE